MVRNDFSELLPLTLHESPQPTCHQILSGKMPYSAVNTANIIGTACFSRGIIAMLSPREEYSHMGLPLSPADSPSPLMYFKGLREASYGLTLVALQNQSSELALTTFAAVLAIVRLGDGVVVWFKGGDELRYKAWGHWITGAGMAWWAVWRARNLGLR
jgi:hypothetical protein